MLCRHLEVLQLVHPAEEPEQRLLWTESLDPEVEPTEFIITSLIYGIRTVSGLTEAALTKLGEAHPELAGIFKTRYVDDLGFSVGDDATATDIVTNVGSVLSSYGIQVKGWCISGLAPPQERSDLGVCKLAGHLWNVEDDIFSFNISKVIKEGRKLKGSIAHLEVFTGTSLRELLSRKSKMVQPPRKFGSIKLTPCQKLSSQLRS